MEKPTGIDEVIESEAFQKHGLRYVGIGAEKIVFETDGSDKKLIKIDLDTLRNKILSYFDSHHEYAIAVSLDEKELKKEYQAQEQAIGEVFGREHVLEKGFFRYKIPITKELVSATMGESGSKIIKKLDEMASIPEIEMIVETQLIAEELKNPAERHVMDLSIPLVRYDSFVNSKNIQEGLSKIEDKIDRNMKIYKEQLLNSDPYVEVEKEIIKNIIKYTKATGQIMDIFGPNNITIFLDKDSNEPNFHLLDVIMPGPRRRWDMNIKDDPKLSLLRHCYTFYYGINRWAKELGVAESLELGDLTYFKGSELPTGDFIRS